MPEFDKHCGYFI